MSMYMLSVSNVSRAKKQSSTAALAYQSGLRVFDERTGKTYNYSRKDRVVYTNTLIPEGSPEEYRDPVKLFNALEMYETKGDARTVKKLMIVLPRELSEEDRKTVIEEFLHKEFISKGYCASYSIHDDEDGHNPHVHVIVTNRAIGKDGQWKTKQKSVFALDENGEKIPVIDPATGKQKERVRKGKGTEKVWKRVNVETNPLDSREQLKEIRKSWEVVCNKKLSAENAIDSRSYKDRGIAEEKEPTIHEGYYARMVERNGGTSYLREENRQIQERNKQRATLKEELQQLGETAVSYFKEQIERLRNVFLELIMEKEKQQAIEAEKRQEEDKNLQILDAFIKRTNIIKAEEEKKKQLNKRDHEVKKEQNTVKDQDKPLTAKERWERDEKIRNSHSYITARDINIEKIEGDIRWSKSKLKLIEEARSETYEKTIKLKNYVIKELRAADEMEQRSNEMRIPKLIGKEKALKEQRELREKAEEKRKKILRRGEGYLDKKLKELEPYSYAVDNLMWLRDRTEKDIIGALDSHIYGMSKKYENEIWASLKDSERSRDRYYRIDEATRKLAIEDKEHPRVYDSKSNIEFVYAELYAEEYDGFKTKYGEVVIRDMDTIKDLKQMVISDEMRIAVARTTKNQDIINFLADPKESKEVRMAIIDNENVKEDLLKIYSHSKDVDIAEKANRKIVERNTPKIKKHEYGRGGR